MKIKELINSNTYNQAHLKAARADAQPKLLKELVNSQYLVI
jgi:hypothetical protein